MTGKQAREIVRTQNKQLDHNKRMNTQTVTEEYKYIAAGSYLEAIEKMRPIVEAIKLVDWYTDGCGCCAEESVKNNPKIKAAFTLWPEISGEE